MRRGGFGDAGGVGCSGELPRAAPVVVPSEERLREEVEGIAASLRSTVDWTRRVEALLRLEGLVLGGAAQQHAAFAECVQQVLRDPLTSQVLERRSAVSRQACHALSLLAEACGDRLEPLVVQLLPVLLRAIAMGIQVVTDAADACARALLRHCHASKVLPRLCSTVAGDKNGKLRQCASSYLLQALEEWDPSLFDKHLDAVEAAILAAAQDAQSDTRATGRQLYATFGSMWPAQAAALVQRVDRDKALQERLLQALEARRPGALLPMDGSSSLGRRSSFGNANSTQPSTPRGSSCSASVQGLGSAAAAASSMTAGPALGPMLSGAARPPPVVPRLALSSLTGSGSSSPTSGSAAPSRPNSARLPAGTATGITPWAVRQPPATARVPRLGLNLLHEGENQRPNSGASTPRGLQAKPAGATKTSAGTEGPRALPGGRLGARKSMGGAALRINIAALAQEQGSEGDASEDMCSAGAAQPQQLGSLSARWTAATAHHPPLSARTRRQSALPATLQGGHTLHAAARPDMLPARRVEVDQGSVCSDSTISELAPGSSALDDRQPAAPLVHTLGHIGKAGTSWADKVQLFGSLAEALGGSGGGPHPEVAANIDRVAACLLDGVGDAHFKVATAALEALAAGLAGRNAKLFEPQLDRMMPVLFLRASDAKEQVKALAGAALGEVPRRQPADAVLSALARSLQQARAPRVRAAVMEYFSAAATGALAPGLDEALELAPGPALRALTAGVLAAALDKNAEVRRAAVRAAGVVHMAAAAAGAAGSAVVVALQALPPAEAAALQRALGPSLPSLEADLAAALGASRPPPVAGAGAAAAPTASSRRHSGEGLRRLPELPLALLAARGAAGGVDAACPPAPPSSKPLPSAPAPSSAGSHGTGALASVRGAHRLQQGRSGSGLVSPRSASPGRQATGDASPPAASPPLSRLGRQSSNLSCGSSAVEAREHQAARQPSSCVNHTSSPVACPPPHPQPAPLAAGLAGSPQDPSPLGRAPGSSRSGNWGPLGASSGLGDGPAQEQEQPARLPASSAQAPASSMADLAPFDEVMEGQLRRLMAQLHSGPSAEVFQGLRRLAHVLPGSAWASHFSQVLSAVLAALGSASPLLREAGLMIMRDLAAAQPDLHVGPLPALLPRLLDCCVDPSREVMVAADEALEQLLGSLPPMPCLALLLPRLPQSGTALSADLLAGGRLYAALKNLRRVVRRLSAPEAQAALLPDLVPGLCTAYCSPIADVRKATVDCLVALWLVLGDVLVPHLRQLSTSQMKLLSVYREKALARS